MLPMGNRMIGGKGKTWQADFESNENSAVRSLRMHLFCLFLEANL